MHHVVVMWTTSHTFTIELNDSCFLWSSRNCPICSKPDGSARYLPLREIAQFLWISNKGIHQLLSFHKSAARGTFRVRTLQVWACGCERRGVPLLSTIKTRVCITTSLSSLRSKLHFLIPPQGEGLATPNCWIWLFSSASSQGLLWPFKHGDCPWRSWSLTGEKCFMFSDHVLIADMG